MDLAHDAKQVFLKGPLIRLYANLPLILSLGNALSIVEQILQMVTTTSFGGGYDCKFTDDFYPRCQNFNGGAKYYYSCPYQTDSVYLGMLNTFIAYYCILIVTKMLWLFRYSTSDLRYYLASDRYATTNINRILHYIGILLVMGFAVFGIYVAVVLGNTSGVGPMASFFAVNGFALYAGTVTHYTALQNIPLDHDIFKNEVRVKLLDKQSFIAKVTRSHYDVIDCFIRDVMDSRRTDYEGPAVSADALLIVKTLCLGTRGEQYSWFRNNCPCCFSSEQ